MKIALAQINPTIGDFNGNTEKIIKALERGRGVGADLVLFSEMVLCGYPPEDFLLHQEFLEKAEEALQAILPFTQSISAVLGTVRRQDKFLYNSAVILSKGQLLGYQDKALLPTYDIFDEKRYFTPAEKFHLFKIGEITLAITICEDLWEHAGKLKYANYPRDPVQEIARMKPDLVLNLSASPYHFQKYKERHNVVVQAAQTLSCPLFLCNQVGGNDSLIFDGYSIAVNEKGECLAELKGFEEDFQLVGTLPQPSLAPDSLEDLRKALVLGIRDYFHKSGFKKACLGLSGGVDSALVACLAVEALGKENVLAVAMPSCYSSPSSLRDAQELIQNLDITLLEIPIEAPFQAYLDLLDPHFEGKPVDRTEENLQARIRGMILMALSNKQGYMVLSTGNKSELAMGYSTLYGDLTGGLAVISDLTKEKVYQLSRTFSSIPPSILEKAPSAELRPNQKDSDSLPPYPLIDAVLEAYVEQNHTPETIAKNLDLPLEFVQSLIYKIHQSEYKRRQAPLGLRVTEKAFTVGRRFPIIQKFIPLFHYNP